jgi:DNA replication protein DnaC
MAVQNLFRLQFVEDHSSVIMLGTVGLDKTHLATALGYTACLAGESVLFANAVNTINTLAAAQAASRLSRWNSKSTLHHLDEHDYLPIYKHGVDLLFQVISMRHERGSTVTTSDRAFKQWPEIFNGVQHTYLSYPGSVAAPCGNVCH